MGDKEERLVELVHNSNGTLSFLVHNSENARLIRLALGAYSYDKAKKNKFSVKEVDSLCNQFIKVLRGAGKATESQ